MEVGWQAQTEEVLLKMFYNLSQTLYVLGRRTESFEIILDLEGWETDRRLPGGEDKAGLPGKGPGRDTSLPAACPLCTPVIQ